MDPGSWAQGIYRECFAPERTLILLSRRVVLSLKLASKHSVVCLGHLLSSVLWNTLSRFVESLSSKRDGSGRLELETSLPRSSHLLRISHHLPQPLFWLWLHVKIFPLSFQIPSASHLSYPWPFSLYFPKSSYLLDCGEIIIYLLTLGFLSNLCSPKSMKLYFNLSSHCSLLSNSVLVAAFFFLVLTLLHALPPFDYSS